MKRNNRILSVFVVLTSLGIAAPAQASAVMPTAAGVKCSQAKGVTAYGGYMTFSAVNLRAKPSTTSKVLAKVPAGVCWPPYPTIQNVAGNDWAKVTYKGKGISM